MDDSSAYGEKRSPKHRIMYSSELEIRMTSFVLAILSWITLAVANECIVLTFSPASQESQDSWQSASHSSLAFSINNPDHHYLRTKISKTGFTNAETSEQILTEFPTFKIHARAEMFSDILCTYVLM